MGKSSPPDETPEAQALAQVSAERFNRYKQVFAPLEDAYIKDVFNVRDQGNYETAGGVASAQYQPEFEKAKNQLDNEMFSQGVDPTSGAFQQNSAALRRAQAVKQGIGISGAKVQNTDRFYRGLQGVINIGQGQASQAISGLSGIAETATKNAVNQAENSFNAGSAARKGVLGVAGMAVSPFVDSKLKSASGLGG